MMNKIILATVASVVALTFADSKAQSQERGVKDDIVYTAPEGGNRGLIGEVRLYNRSHAVVIGIDEYPQMAEAEQLHGAVRDAEAIAELLITHGFHEDNIHLMLNEDATRADIVDKISNELSNTVGPDDRVIVYFAGHGTTWKDTLGYILPHDGEFARATSTGISMDELQKWLSRFKSKHVMFIADSCYSGLGLANADVRGPNDFDHIPDYLQRVLDKPARIALVAGSKDEQVLEWGEKGHGLFTWYLLEGLRGAADINNDGLITSLELRVYITPRVMETASARFNRPQQPHAAQYGEGEIMFLTPKQWLDNRCPEGLVWRLGGCLQPGQEVEASGQRGEGVAPTQVQDDGPSGLLWTGIGVGSVGLALVGTSLYGSAFVIGPDQDEYDTSPSDDLKEQIESNQRLYRGFLFAGLGLSTIGIALVVVDTLADDEPGESASSIDFWMGSDQDSAGVIWRGSW